MALDENSVASLKLKLNKLIAENETLKGIEEGCRLRENMLKKALHERDLEVAKLRDENDAIRKRMADEVRQVELKHDHARMASENRIGDLMFNQSMNQKEIQRLSDELKKMRIENAKLSTERQTHQVMSDKHATINRILDQAASRVQQAEMLMSEDHRNHVLNEMQALMEKNESLAKDNEELVERVVNRTRENRRQEVKLNEVTKTATNDEILKHLKAQIKEYQKMLTEKQSELNAINAILMESVQFGLVIKKNPIESNGTENAKDTKAQN